METFYRSETPILLIIAVWVNGFIQLHSCITVAVTIKIIATSQERIGECKGEDLGSRVTRIYTVI
jgi:hypothetical protein